jgi:hypothetical protein
MIREMRRSVSQHPPKNAVRGERVSCLEPPSTPHNGATGAFHRGPHRAVMRPTNRRATERPESVSTPRRTPRGSRRSPGCRIHGVSLGMALVSPLRRRTRARRASDSRCRRTDDAHRPPTRAAAPRGAGFIRVVCGRPATPSGPVRARSGRRPGVWAEVSRPRGHEREISRATPRPGRRAPRRARPFPRPCSCRPGPRSPASRRAPRASPRRPRA